MSTTGWRDRPGEWWLAAFGLGIALSPTNTKIAGAAWLLVCLAGLVVLFRRPVDARRQAIASQAWLLACAGSTALAVVVAAFWPDRPDTLHAEFRLLFGALATHQLARRLPASGRWGAIIPPVLAAACVLGLGLVIVLGDRMKLPSNPIPWAVALSFVPCVLLPFALEGGGSRGQRMALALCSLAGLAAVFLSQSRGALGVLVWVVWLLVTSWRRQHAGFSVRALAMVGLVCSAALAGSAWLPNDPLRLRQGWNEVVVAAEQGNYSSSMGARMYLWNMGWRGFVESPWIGVGGHERLKRIKSTGLDLPAEQRARFEEVRNVGHVHNQYLHAAMDGGLIGLASTLAVLAGLGAAAWRLRRFDPVASRQMQGVLFMHATAGLTNVNMAHNYYAIMLSLSVTLILVGAGQRTGSDASSP